MKEPILKDSTPHDEKICGENAKDYVMPFGTIKDDDINTDDTNDEDVVGYNGGLDLWKPSYSINDVNVLKNISVFLISDMNQTTTQSNEKKMIDIHEYQLNNKKVSDNDGNDRENRIVENGKIERTNNHDDYNNNNNVKVVTDKTYDNNETKVMLKQIYFSDSGNSNKNSSNKDENSYNGRNPKSLFSSDRIFAIQFYFGQLGSRTDNQFIIQGRFRFLEKGKCI